MTLCRAFRCLPSQLLAESGEMLRWMAIDAAGTGEI